MLRGPQAQLFYDPLTGCNPLSVSFSSIVKNTIQYIWDYGDGVTQTTTDTLCKHQNLFIPNTFSPNGDGMNDYFYPGGKELFTIKSLPIFSRWGNIVFERMNFPPNEQFYGWNRTYQERFISPMYMFL
jgi:gliding motility-associated-like protein